MSEHTVTIRSIEAFTSLPDADHLEFTIKSYPDHDGVTEQIGQTRLGDRLVIGDA